MEMLKRGFVALTLAVVTACATPGQGGLQCARLFVANEGYENIRLYVDGRRVGMVEGFSYGDLGLCGIQRVRSVEVEAVGGRYAFSVRRDMDDLILPSDTLAVRIGEFEARSVWVR